mmetsp:Transcript_37383/g.112838  ORF Transcript_37383/g.112838 Transcript_37383/m.112838 type:complete len:208 (-) Transcript_37383:687-1310(-)
MVRLQLHKRSDEVRQGLQAVGFCARHGRVLHLVLGRHGIPHNECLCCRGLLGLGGLRGFSAFRKLGGTRGLGLRTPRVPTAPCCGPGHVRSPGLGALLAAGAGQSRLLRHSPHLQCLRLIERACLWCLDFSVGSWLVLAIPDVLLVRTVIPSPAALALRVALWVIGADDARAAEHAPEHGAAARACGAHGEEVSLLMERLLAHGARH